LALVNRRGTQTEGRLLNFRGSGTYGVGPVMFAPASREEVTYKAGPGTAPPDADWLRDAELLVTEWLPLGSYQVRLQVRVQD
jgi:hypothetical protein